MRPAEVVRRGADYLERHEVQSPLADAEQLLRAVLGTDRAGLYTRTDPLGSADAKAYGRALCRRCTGTPLQHVTGEQGFRRLVLSVRPGVFVPRPETEVLVEVALEVCVEDAPLVADVGTGTGAVALAVKDERPAVTVWATDVSSEAVALARANAARLGLDVQVREGDLLGPLPVALQGSFSLVLSNPPYVSAEELRDAPAEVLADPPRALEGGPEFYRRLLGQAHAWLRPGGHVAVEIGETQGAAVRALAVEGGFEEVRVRQDLTGRDRVVVARRP